MNLKALILVSIAGIIAFSAVSAHAAGHAAGPVDGSYQLAR